MFILDRKAFSNNTAENIDAFVNCWSSFYNETPGDVDGHPINYLQELNLNKNLTEQNIQKLLRWKSPRHLTHENKDGKQNSKVQKSLKGIETVNSFRNKQITDNDFLDFTGTIFSNGFVYRAFLFHIARPAEYPIWDQHVARVHARLTNGKETVDWEHYENYRIWFANLKITLKIENELSVENMQKTKRLDDALMAFGQFLMKYTID
jgi:hypothetical protein